jgi:protein ImuA
MPRASASVLVDLKARIARIERGGGAQGVVPLGVPAMDGVLPNGGIATGAVHEVMGSAAGGFVTMLAGRLAGPVLWCVMASSRAELFGPGLAAFGLDTRRLVIVRCASRDDMLWAMEEGLRDPALVAVVGEPGSPITLGASRRLQIAAETSGVTGLILRRGATAGALAPSAVFSRWHVESAPLLGVAGMPPRGARWHLALQRCRGGFGGMEKAWLVDWCDATRDLSLVSQPGYRPVAAAGERRLAG